MKRSASSILAVSRWMKITAWSLGVVFILLSIVGIWVSREPKVFWVTESADRDAPIVGLSTADTLIRVAETLLEKRGGKVEQRAILPVRFVPMTGRAQQR